MVVKKSLLKTSFKPGICLFILIPIVGIFTASANNYSDTTKKKLLASLDKKGEAAYITREANVVFPDILKGNEEKALSYVENFSNKKRDYLLRMYNKGKALLPKAAAILQKYNLPVELKILLTLESAYNGNAVSKAGAVGYWQIMDEVAKEYGMKYVAYLSPAEKKKLLKAAAKKGHKLKLQVRQDDRKNFNTATNAAACYLRDRRRNLDDNWLLIVASYNCGVGNVWNAMQKSGKTNPDFWDIKKYLPAETRAYVMNFIALNVIFHNYEKFAKNTLNFTPIKVKAVDNFEENGPDKIEEPVTLYND